MALKVCEAIICVGSCFFCCFVYAHRRGKYLAYIILFAVAWLVLELYIRAALISFEILNVFHYFLSITAAGVIDVEKQNIVRLKLFEREI